MNLADFANDRGNFIQPIGQKFTLVSGHSIRCDGLGRTFLDLCHA
ncbi:hypothetical protein [Fodinicurvata halophila]